MKGATVFWRRQGEAGVIGRGERGRGCGAGRGPLRDQLSRALQNAYLQTDEGAAKSGALRRVRLS